MRSRRIALQTASALAALLLLLPLAGTVRAGGMDMYEWDGAFEAGFRYVDVGGNENKYREDLNFETSPVLFLFDLTGTPSADENGMFDLLNLRAEGIGNEPYETVELTLKKFRSYNFRYSRIKSDYFYHDIILPVELSTPSLSNAGDFHAFDFTHTFHQLDFDFRIQDRAKVFFNFDSQKKAGDSETTRDVSRDEFELEQPIEQLKNDYEAGVELWFDKATVMFSQLYRDYEDDGHLLLPGYSAGEDPEDATELISFEQLLPYEYTMPQTTIRANLRPAPGATINASYSYAKIDAEFGYFEHAMGTDFRGNPLDETVAGGGEIERTNNMFDIDASYAINPTIALLGEYRYRKLDQDGTLAIIGDSPEARDYEISKNGFDVGARITPNAMAAITAGLRFESRDITLHGDEEPSTDQTSFFAAAALRPNAMAHIVAEYEYGDYDEPFTLVSPTTMNRFKVKARLTPNKQLGLDASYLYRKLDNDLSDAEVTSNHFGVNVNYRAAMARVFGGFYYTKLDNEIVNLLSTDVLYPALYEAKTTGFRAGIDVDASDMIKLGFDMLYYTNDGSFELDRQQYRLFGMLQSPSGYRLRIGYEYHDYNEDAADWDDYDANILTVAVGYGFGR